MLDLVSTSCNNLGTVEVRCSQFNVHEPLRRAFHDTHPRTRTYAIFYNTLVFLRQGGVRPRHNLKMGDHTLSVVRDCLFSIRTATFYMIRGVASKQNLST